MAAVYVPRAFGGTLILSFGANQAGAELVTTFRRDNLAMAFCRDNLVTAVSRNDLVRATSRDNQITTFIHDSVETGSRG